MSIQLKLNAVNNPDKNVGHFQLRFWVFHITNIVVVKSQEQEAFVSVPEQENRV